jgi:uncharacterized integral membrane protein
MKRFKLIVAALIAVLVIIVIFQNRGSVQVKLLWATVAMPRAMLLAVTFLVGAIGGLLLASNILRRSKRK